MAMGGTGIDYDVSYKLGGTMLQTTVSQYSLVGMQPNTTTVCHTAYRCNAGVALEDTQTARHCIGVNQSLLSASSTELTVRRFGLSKVICASSVAAGDLLVAYEGVSTTTRAGQVESLSRQDEANTTCGAYGMSVAAMRVVVGRAEEDGSTGTTIRAFINPSPYDNQFWASS